MQLTNDDDSLSELFICSCLHLQSGHLETHRVNKSKVEFKSKRSLECLE